MNDATNQGQKDSEMIREAVATADPRESGADDVAYILDNWYRKTEPPEAFDLVAHRLAKAYQALESLLSTQQAEVERMMKLAKTYLERIGCHAPNCFKMTHPLAGCDCGYAILRSALARPAPPKAEA